MTSNCMNRITDIDFLQTFFDSINWIFAEEGSIIHINFLKLTWWTELRMILRIGGGLGFTANQTNGILNLQKSSEKDWSSRPSSKESRESSAGNNESKRRWSKEFVQGAFFNCSHPKISKYKKKQSIRTVPTQKCLKCGKAHAWIFWGEESVKKLPQPFH